MPGNASSRLVRSAGAVALGGFIALSALADSTTLAPGDASATVTGSSAVSMDFVVSRGGDLGYDAFLAYRTADDTALAGSDYTASSGTVLIPAGAGSATVSVPVLGSSAPKSDRAFKLDMSGAVGVGPAPSFVTGGSTGVGYVPKAVAVGDFNGDGKPDLAVANSQSGNVSILRNSTAPGADSSTFTPAATLGAGGNLIAIVAADFNGDGKPDVAVVASSSSSVSVMLNRTAPGAGSASFYPAASFGVGSTPMSIAVGDFNGDGKPDLATADYSSSTVSVLFNNTAPGASSASFAAAATVAAGSLPSGVTAGDFNGDGRIDLAAANAASNDVSILLNNTLPGDTVASFALAATVPASSNPSSIVSGDFNGDGKPDLAVSNLYGHNVSILFNDTQPAAAGAVFTVAATVGLSSNGGPIAAGDFNADGKLDLAVGVQFSGHVSILRNETIPGASRGRFTIVTNAASSSLPWSLAVDDFNGDGRPDLAVTNYYENSASILLNTTPAPAAEVGYRTDTLEGVANIPYDIAVSDFNGDGKRDMAVVNRGGDNVSILLSGTAPGAAGSQFTLAGSPAAGSLPWSAVAADFNTDGKPDLAVSNISSNNLSILLNTTAPGATSTSFTLAASPAAGSSPSGLAVGDFNGDGKPDLAAVSESDTVAVLLNTTVPGAASASFAPAVSFGAGSMPISVAVADFNGDGKPDLAAASYNDDSVSVLLNTTAPGAADASFAPATSMVVGDAPWDVALGDFNGDGRPDLAVTIFNGDSVAVLLNTTAPGATSAGFTLAANPGVGNSPYSVAVGDFNGDGRPDLATANLHGAASVLFNTAEPGAAGASFALAASPAVGAQSVAVTADDFNGDGRPDLAVANAGSDSVSVLLNTQYLASASGSATGTIRYSIPAASLNPSSLVFGSQRVGSSGAAQTVALSNSGSAPLTVDSIVANGDFSQSNDCAESLAPGAQCSISVVFRPTATGARSGTLTVATNAAGSPATVSLSGEGIESIAKFSAASLSFGEQPVGTTSTAQMLTLNNPGSATLNIASIMASGDFVQHNDCGVMLLPGNSCTISVTFTPAVSGARSGTITVLSDAASSPSIVDLSGTGAAPIVHLSMSVLNFGSLYIGSSSAAQSVTLSNTGNGVLQIASLKVSEDFSIASDCGTTLAPAASCTINVSFTPQAAGVRSGTLTLSSNAASSPDSVSLSGTGMKHDTQLTVNPALGTLIPPQLYLGASAQLQQTTPTVAPLGGKTVNFTTRSGAALCSGVTDASGHASCRGSLSILGILLGGGYRGSFAGDAQYNGSEDASPVLEALP